jgi:thiamine kinase-like enzyme
MGRSSAAARTLCHGDVRLENVFFNEDASDIMFIDFQMLVKGTPAQDVQYLFGSSMNPEVWDKEGMRLLELYHNELVAQGVTNYSFDTFWSEFQLQCLWAMVAPASTVGGFDMGDDKGKQLAERWMTRGWYLPVAANARQAL